MAGLPEKPLGKMLGSVVNSRVPAWQCPKARRRRLWLRPVRPVRPRARCLRLVLQSMTGKYARFTASTAHPQRLTRRNSLSRTAHPQRLSRRNTLSRDSRQSPAGFGTFGGRLLLSRHRRLALHVPLLQGFCLQRQALQSMSEALEESCPGLRRSRLLLSRYRCLWRLRQALVLQSTTSSCRERAFLMLKTYRL